MSSSEELDPETESDIFESEESGQYKSGSLSCSHQIQMEKTSHRHLKSSRIRFFTSKSSPQVMNSQEKKRKTPSSSETDSEVIKRLKTIEKNLKNLDTRMKNVETKVDNLETKVDDLRVKVDKMETKLNHLYEPVQARHIEKWAQEVWQFDSIEGVSAYVFSAQRDPHLSIYFQTVKNALQQNEDYKNVYQAVWGKAFRKFVEQEVNLFSRCYLRRAPNWPHVASSSSNQIIPDQLTWNAILLVETTTTDLPTNLSDEFKAFINNNNNNNRDFTKLRHLIHKRGHLPEKSLLQKLLQMERQVLLLRVYYRIQGHDNVFLILSSPLWKQRIPRMKTQGDAVLAEIFGSDNIFSRAFANLKEVYDHTHFIARGI